MGAQGLRPTPRDSRCQGQPPARHLVKYLRKGRNWTMVLGLKPMGKPSTKKGKITSFGHNQGLAWSSDSSLWGNQLPVWESPRLKYGKVLRPIRVLGWWRDTSPLGNLRGLFIFVGDMSANDYFLHRIKHPVLIVALFRASIVIHRCALLWQTILLKLWWHLFISKHFGLSRHWFKCYVIVPSSACKFIKT